MRFEDTIVKHGKWALAALAALALLGTSCSSGGGNDNNGDNNNGPLELNLAAAVPTTGGTPLRVTFTADISGGVGPYFYAWDFDARDTNSNATFEPSELVFDRYLNNQFDKTISVANDYFLNASDAGGSTGYTAVLRVTDSENTVLYSSPINILVNSSAGFSIDPAGTFWFTDELASDGTYVARTGLPVYFRAAVLGGAQPLAYQWDFNDDGTIDSTVQSPQFTFTVPEPGVDIFTPHLTVVDDNGEQLGYDFAVPVNGPSAGGDPPPAFTVLLGTNPPAQSGVVQLRYDPTGSDPNLPREPELDLSIVVSPNPDQRGVPPYEYYWDFESDGSFDSSAPSPNIPYFKPGAVVSTNPFLITEDTKNFVLTVTVIDSAGQIQKLTQNIQVVKSISRPVDPIIVDIDYNIVGSTVPFGEVGGSGDTQEVDFVFTLPNLANASQVYEWQMDIDGDGNADPIDFDNDSGTAPEAGFKQLPTNSKTVARTRVTFGPYDDDLDGLGNGDWPIPNYYAVSATFRRLASAGGGQEDQVAVQVPVSFVEVNNVSIDGSLTARSEHTMVPLFRVVNGGQNGQGLAQRDAVIIGGANNNNALTSVQRITQQYTLPTIAFERESLTGQTTATNSVSMTVARRGQASFVVPTDQNDFYNGGAYFSMGGRNSETGLLTSTELQPANDNGGTIGWQVGPEITVPQSYALVDAFSSPFVNLICGGLHKATPASTSVVSAATIVYNAQNDPTNPLEPGAFDGTGNFGANMITPRYDGTLAVVTSPSLLIYAIGGREAGGQSVATVEVLDPNTGVWSPAPSMQNARSGCTAQSIDNKIYVWGGAYYPDNEADKTLVLTAEVFNPTTGVWSYTVAPAAAVNNGASVSFPGPGSVSATNGVNLNTVWLFGGETLNNGDSAALQEFVFFYDYDQTGFF
ncbi:hypothetical protein IT575_02145 [bacterium]|nr:hypothetical protein [bacterium]